jgi:hypothetical protein
MRVTLQDAIDFGIPTVIGACGLDPRFLRVLNEGIQRLLFKGKWWGTVQRFRFCVTDGEVTLPKQIATIEAAAVCGYPVQVRDMWYEFLENGFGIRQAQFDQPSTSNGSNFNRVWGTNECLYRGRYPTFSNVMGTDKRLNLFCDRSSDIGKPVLLLGWDQNNNWIRTLQSGTMADGEVVQLLQAPGSQTINLFSSVTDIQPPNNLDGQWWLYEFSTTALTNRLIGHYQYDDTRPSFARYLLPGINQQQPTPSTCNYTPIELAGKLDFIPAKKPTDYLIIGNLPALKEICMGINNSENEPDGRVKVSIINSAMQSAAVLLDQELDHYLGSGRKQGMNVQFYSDDYPIENFI